MKRLKKYVVAAFVFALMCASGMGCNTVHGAGRDIEKGGEAIQNAADDASK